MCQEMWHTRVRQPATSTSTRCCLAGNSMPARSNHSPRRSALCGFVFLILYLSDCKCSLGTYMYMSYSEYVHVLVIAECISARLICTVGQARGGMLKNIEICVSCKGKGM